MSLKHPPSRLSPPPGTRDTDIIDSAHMDLQGGDRLASPDEDSKDGIKDKRNDAPKRGYRACVHCRLRKARCDLGDVNSPSEPPCTRCRREQRNCVFLPSVSHYPDVADGRNGAKRTISTLKKPCCCRPWQMRQGRRAEGANQMCQT
jgi:hypothetical protein